MAYSDGYAGGYTGSIVGAGLKARINHADVQVVENTLRIEDTIEIRSVATFTVETTSASDFRKGQFVEILDGSALVWTGVLEKPAVAAEPPGDVNVWELQAVDWHEICDRRIVAASYENMAVGAVVLDVFTRFLGGETLTVDTIETGPVVLEAVFNYITVAEAFDALAEKAGFTWWIDRFRRLHFRSRGSVAAPWSLTWDDCDDAPPTLANGAPLYRNRQYIRGARDITDPQAESFVGDGVAQAFTLGFPAAKAPTVKVNGVTKTLGIRGLETGFEWYWQKDSEVISQDLTGVPLTSSDTLQVTYQGTFPVVVVSQDAAEIVRLKTVRGFGTGLVELVDDEPLTTTREAAFESAAAKLAKYAAAGRTLHFRTVRSGLAPGQLLTVTLAEYGLTAEDFLITEVEISEEDSTIWYGVEAVQGPVGEAWVRFFDRMVRGGGFVLRENIAEGETLALLELVAESWSWGESVTPTVNACPTPSTTLFPSTSLLPC